MQIALVKSAIQTFGTCEPSKVSVDRIFVPTNVPLRGVIYENTGEVSFCSKLDLPLWDDYPSRKKSRFGAGEAGAQDKFVSQAKHRPTRLGLVNNITGHVSTLELPNCVDKK
jgi:hypothetical protein